MLTVTSPLPGRVIALETVPDPVFAEAMVGPGTAVDPTGGTRGLVIAGAPIDGTLVSLHPHAFVVVSDDGRGVLVHLGIDTVQLNGEGFEPLLRKGDPVRRGEGVVRWDPEAVEVAGRSPVCPVIALEALAGSLTGFANGAGVEAGDQLFVWE
ncbi:PTS sugar transporter subunit IIA [Streptomyces abyssomicinicus]|uniref:PTS sugar transporter subunit IIA n=1 Tax=Streptomyces abyssomicinicus TaxID=574929 RepID=UPI0012506F2D|nr:PTS glucose transporter subunit IIA [Streptomyces abyssomicinicus]